MSDKLKAAIEAAGIIKRFLLDAIDATNQIMALNDALREATPAEKCSGEWVGDDMSPVLEHTSPCPVHPAATEGGETIEFEALPEFDASHERECNPASPSLPAKEGRREQWLKEGKTVEDVVLLEDFGETIPAPQPAATGQGEVAHDAWWANTPPYPANTHPIEISRTAWSAALASQGDEIKALRDYVSFLENECGKNAVLAMVHGFETSAEVVAEGKRLRENIARAALGARLAYKVDLGPNPTTMIIQGP
jgi:hypothetical protein